MELEFDKEIDALLRKARSGTSADKFGDHLDADAIAAFAEGAVPNAVRKTYTTHLADCDRCRKALSHVAVLNEPAEMKAVAATATAAAPAMRPAAPAPANKMPWYRPLFRSPGLAAAFGVLVLAFGGIFIYLLTNRNAANSSSTVALQENEPASAVPYAGIDTNSNANAASAMSNATSAANTASNTSRSTVSNAVNSSANSITSNGGAAVGGSFGQNAPAATSTAQPSSAAAPPRADLPTAPRNVTGLPLDKPKTEIEAGKDKNERKETTRNRALSDNGLARGEINAKKAAGSPPRAAAQVQNQMQVNTQADEIAVTRHVGGKTFRNSNGAWYDAAYRGQSTTNVRRGTDEFLKLDSGLRSIANDLSGIVVVVWRDKAYRIQ